MRRTRAINKGVSMSNQIVERALTPSKTQRSVEARALYFAAGAAASAFVIALCTFWGSTGVQMSGWGSIGSVAVILATITAFVGYFYVMYQGRPHLEKSSSLHKVRVFFTMFALSFVHAAITFLVLMAGFYLVHLAFLNVTIDRYASSAIVAVAVGAVGYGIYLIAAHKTTSMVSAALAVFLVAGALTSMITAGNPYWWEMHLSSLGGAGGGASAYVFNITLIIGGAVLVAVADLIASDFEQLAKVNKRFNTTHAAPIRTTLAFIGVALAGVGLFEWNVYPLVHNVSAGIMVVLFIGLMIALPKLVPAFSRAFFLFSGVILWSLLGGMVLYYFLGYFNLTAYELFCFAVLFGWLIVFVRQIAAALQDEAPRKSRTA